MAYLCATEHLRGVTPDESDCLGLDERRQLDELLRVAREAPENYENMTSQPGPSPPAEVPDEPSRDDLDIGMNAVEQMTLWKEQKKQRDQPESESNQFRGDMKRILDSRIGPKFLTKKLEVLSSNCLVWRRPL